jgi:uncharacterized protein (TIGR02285 family)
MQRFLMFLFLCQLVLCLKLTAKENPSIIWKRFDFPPVSILSGPQTDQGYTDILQDYVIQKLPQYEHIREVTNLQRAVLEAKNSDNICSTSLLKTPEREAYMEFSNEAYTMYPVGAIILNSELEKFRPYINADEVLDLDTLLVSEEFSIGLMAHRVYGGVSQDVTDKYKQSALAQSYSMSDLLESLFKILNYAQRVDLILGYPVEMVYLANKLNLDLNSLRFININAAQPLVSGYISCSRSPVGHEIIGEINKILNDGGRDVAKHAYTRWLDPLTLADYQRRQLSQ